MIRARVTALFVFLALPLGIESTAWADDTEPPTLTPEQLAALCEVLDDEIATVRFDPGTFEPYRAQCSELDSAAIPGTNPGVPPAAPESPTDKTPEQTTETAASPPSQARTSESSAASAPGEPDPDGSAPARGHATSTSVLVEPVTPAAPTELVQHQPDSEGIDSEAPVAGAFDLPTFDYADLLLSPEVSPVFGSTASSVDEAHSPGEADLVAAGSAIPFATEQDRLPRSAFLATGLISLTGVALLRSYLARRN